MARNTASLLLSSGSPVAPAASPPPTIMIRLLVGAAATEPAGAADPPPFSAEAEVEVEGVMMRAAAPSLLRAHSNRPVAGATAGAASTWFALHMQGSI